jgi:hypothetical protein
VLLPGHPSVGRQIANPVLADGQRLDAALGDGFSFVTAPGRYEQVTTLAKNRFAECRANVVVAEPEQLPFSLGPNTAVFVRPDRTVAAVIDLSADPTADDLHVLLARYGLV